MIPPILLAAFPNLDTDDPVVTHPADPRFNYVVRLSNRFYQLLPPVHAGERGGRVVIEERLDGTMAIRFGKHDLEYQEIVAKQRSGDGDCAPKKTRSKRTQPTAQPFKPAADHPWRKRVI